ncbi:MULTISPECIES: hypothetical protein [Moorena]|uniref:hypothetical protein n=1 Tax=Moorena TaxID=1155738 RepID=UPI0002E6CE64|nr:MULTISPECIES: hypothetical protein [Moorena]NEP31394.1 hypothetical protein [Moorena sp. SIO3B2]NEP66498.1 hypothetical protein [Moorena sp. SIO3A5]
MLSEFLLWNFGYGRIIFSGQRSAVSRQPSAVSLWPMAPQVAPQVAHKLISEC